MHVQDLKRIRFFFKLFSIRFGNSLSQSQKIHRLHVQKSKSILFLVEIFKHAFGGFLQLSCVLFCRNAHALVLQGAGCDHAFFSSTVWLGQPSTLWSFLSITYPDVFHCFHFMGVTSSNSVVPATLKVTCSGDSWVFRFCYFFFRLSLSLSYSLRVVMNGEGWYRDLAKIREIASLDIESARNRKYVDV